jgi:hypothetical protein
MPDAGDQMPDAGDQMPDAGDQMPDAGDQMPDAGCRMRQGNHGRRSVEGKTGRNGGSGLTVGGPALKLRRGA